jgi:hypothetical protein
MANKEIILMCTSCGHEIDGSLEEKYINSGIKNIELDPDWCNYILQHHYDTGATQRGHTEYYVFLPGAGVVGELSGNSCFIAYDDYGETVKEKAEVGERVC